MYRDVNDCEVGFLHFLGQLHGSIERQLLVIHLLLQLRDKIVDFHKTIDLIAADPHFIRNDLVGTLLRLRIGQNLHFAAPPGLSRKRLHLHLGSTRQLRCWNIHAVQVAVNNFNPRSIIVYLGDDNRHRVIQPFG